MPPVIVAMIAASVAVFGTAATLVIINVVTYGIFFGALNFAMSGISKLLTKKPNFAALSHDSLTRSVTVRQPISPRKIIYGSVGRLGGIITFLHVEGTTGQFLHLVITLSGHQVNAINTMYFDGVAVPLDGAGNATGNFAGFVFVEKNLGTTTQAAFPDLVAKSAGKWTSAHQQKGRAGVHVRLKWDVNKFPNGAPNITFDIDGALIYDPRSNTRAFSNNSALCIADYLTNTDYGLGAATQKATRIQSTGGSTTYKWYYNATVVNNDDIEIMVYVENIGANPVIVRTGNGQSSYQVAPGTKQNVYLRDRVSGTTAQIGFYAVNVGDALDFLAFNPIIRHAGLDENLVAAANRDFSSWTLGTGNSVTVTQGQIASVEVDRAAIITAANICDEAVPLNAGGTEPRFTTNGVIDTSIVPADAIGSLLTAMAGNVVYTNAVFKIYAGAYISPTESVSEGDLRGDIVIQTTRPKRELFNGVKGLFVSPANGWQPTDFPPKQDTTYLARDRGETIWKDIELPFTTSVPTAQRLAKIDLQRNGRQISITLPLKLSKYTIASLDTIQVSLARFGWVNKTFGVVSVNLVFEDKGHQGYIIGVDVVARETDANSFSWTPAIDELPSTATQTVVLPDNSTLGNLDNGIADGSTYGRTLGSDLTGNRLDFSKGLLNKHLDNIPDGATYSRPLATRINAGKPTIDFSEAIHANKNQDNIADGSTYARVSSSQLVSNLFHNTAMANRQTRNAATVLNFGDIIIGVAGLHSGVDQVVASWTLVFPANAPQYAVPLNFSVAAGSPTLVHMFIKVGSTAGSNVTGASGTSTVANPPTGPQTVQLIGQITGVNGDDGRFSASQFQFTPQDAGNQ